MSSPGLRYIPNLATRAVQACRHYTMQSHVNLANALRAYSRDRRLVFPRPSRRQSLKEASSLATAVAASDLRFVQVGVRLWASLARR